MSPVIDAHAKPFLAALNVMLTLLVIWFWRRWARSRDEARVWRRAALRTRARVNALQGEVGAWRSFKTRTPAKPPPLPAFPPPIQPPLDAQFPPPLPADLQRPRSEYGWGDSHLQTEARHTLQPDPHFDRRRTVIMRRDQVEKLKLK